MIARKLIGGWSMSNQRHCFAWLLNDALAVGKSRAASWREAMWPEKATISISFLMGASDLRARVQAAAEQWIAPGLANLTFEFRDDTSETDVRIAFIQGAGSWSCVGRTCLQVPKSDATMNFGWLTSSSSDEDVEEVVLHEFGHALGLIHEHQHPIGGIQWDKAAIYAELGGPPNNWSKAKVDLNMFQAWETSETNFSAFDPASIMMYPIPEHWTTNGFATGMNKTLSKTDKEFIAQRYP